MSNIILTSIIVLVSAIIGVSIIDALATDATNPLESNESIGTANGTGYLSGTLSNLPVISSTETITCSGVGVASANYTLTDSTGALVVDDIGSCINASVRGIYAYADGSYLDSSLSRTIMDYITPIALLGVLAFAAVFLS